MDNKGGNGKLMMDNNNSENKNTENINEEKNQCGGNRYRGS